MAQGNGGIIGPVNTVSAGKNKITSNDIEWLFFI